LPQSQRGEHILRQETFELFDTWDFPIVRLRENRRRPGNATQWIAEMERLLAIELPFVLTRSA